MKKICLNCQGEFETTRKGKRFCCEACKQSALKSSQIKFLNRFKKINPDEHLPFFHIEEGKLFNSIKQAKRVEEFFVFCHSMLWSTRDFTEVEQNNFKRLIAEHFKDSHNLDERFKYLVEKVVLAKRYVLEKPYRFIAEPQDWLNVKFFSGLSGASKWHEALQEQRKITPNFGESLTVFSEAILNYSQQRNLLDIVFYRHVFIRLKAWDLLQWYMNAVIHYQFINF